MQKIRLWGLILDDLKQKVVAHPVPEMPGIPEIPEMSVIPEISGIPRILGIPKIPRISGIPRYCITCNKCT